jgi:hypothetical protein
VVGSLLWACSPSQETAGGVGGSTSANGSAPALGGGSQASGGRGGNAGTGGLGAPLGGSPGGTAGGGGPAAGGNAEQAAGGAPIARECENQTPELSVKFLTVSTVTALGELFATDTADKTGPTDFGARYGTSPEIVPVADGGGLAVLLQDQTPGNAAHVVHLVPSEGTFRLDAAYEVESLGKIMGFTLDEMGNYYVATGVDEDAEVDAIYPPNAIHRPNIVRVVKFDRSGCVLMESDVDMARGAADAKSEILVNPMVAGSSRLAYGAGQLALVHSHNTEPDPALDGTRHQKAITTHIAADSGEVTRTSSLWVSHSFDQRLFFDGTGLVELHLGDAYPRGVVVGRYLGNDKGVGRELFHMKGALGDNKTFTRLGGIVPTVDPDFGYFVLFATERSTISEGEGEIFGTRDLALVRVRKDFAEVNGSSVDDGPDTTEFAVNSSGQDVVNHLKWLTALGENRHVDRPRIAALPGGEAIALWEEWSVSGNRSTFEGTFALRLDAKGAVLSGPSALAEKHHISRGDDVVTLGGRALYVGGSQDGLELNFVAADLSYERIVVP